MDIQSIVVGGGPVASVVVLQPREKHAGQPLLQLPIKMGVVEASNIGMGADDSFAPRPMTHALFKKTLEALDARVTKAVITDVKDTTFYAVLHITDSVGKELELDSRPSDAISLAVRFGVPIFATEEVLSAAGTPNFRAIQEDEKEKELEGFKAFISELNADDF